MSTTNQDKQPKFTIRTWQRRKRTGEPITVMTAYDYTSAQFVEAAGIEVLLVGDSLNMVMLGRDNTVSLTMDESLHHCRAVARGAQRPFLIGDMPFLSYQVDPREAVLNAGRYLKEGGMDAVKIEGGREIASTAAAIVRAGIPVMGHIGLTPQSISALGGFRAQGRTGSAAYELLLDAYALQEAGCFSIVLESVPAPVAAAITQRLDVATIGIGAGAETDGQVLVFHDMLGLFADFVPKFVKQYAQLRPTIIDALADYKEEVKTAAFPTADHTYSISDEELAAFEEMVAADENGTS